MKSNEDQNKLWAKVVAKAETDEKFKMELLKHPEKVLRDLGLEIPQGKTVKIHENNDKTILLVIKENLKIKQLELNQIQAGVLIDPEDHRS